MAAQYTGAALSYAANEMLRSNRAFMWLLDASPVAFRAQSFGDPTANVFGDSYVAPRSPENAQFDLSDLMLPAVDGFVRNRKPIKFNVASTGRVTHVAMRSESEDDYRFAFALDRHVNVQNARTVAFQPFGMILRVTNDRLPPFQPVHVPEVL